MANTPIFITPPEPPKRKRIDRVMQIDREVPSERLVKESEETLRKVYSGLEDAGVTGDQAIDAVFQMLNRGVLFRERVDE